MVLTAMILRFCIGMGLANHRMVVLRCGCGEMHQVFSSPV